MTSTMLGVEGLVTHRGPAQVLRGISLAVGASYQLTQCLSLSLAYVHDFENSVSGPIVTPRGVIPLSSVKSEISADAVLLGAGVKF